MSRRSLPSLLLLVLLTAAVGAAVGRLIDDGPWWPTAAGAGAGALIGLLVAVVVLRGRRLRDGGEAQRISGLPLVAHVQPPGRGEGEQRRADEAFRMLRAATTLGGEGPAPSVVVVSSAAPGEGKTTVAAGLARAIARAGRPVIAVEADLRRPGLSAALGASTRGTGRGLTAAIVGGVAIDELLQEVEPGLQLLPAGELPPNAPELLGSEDAARVLDELAARGATVVLDTAPLLPVADTRELLGHETAGRVVIVARPGVVTRAELRDAVALLPDGAPAVLAVSGRARTPRSYDRYLRDSSRG